MRKELKTINEQRMRFRATVQEWGTKKNYRGFPEQTVLLGNIIRTDTGEQVTDHLWFTVGKTLARLNLRIGEMIEFDARVSSYVKGYVNNREFIDYRTIDYKLNRPTRFERIPNAQVTSYNSISSS